MCLTLQALKGLNWDVANPPFVRRDTQGLAFSPQDDEHVVFSFNDPTLRPYVEIRRPALAWYQHASQMAAEALANHDNTETRWRQRYQYVFRYLLEGRQGLNIRHQTPQHPETPQQQMFDILAGFWEEIQNELAPAGAVGNAGANVQAPAAAQQAAPAGQQPPNEITVQDVIAFNNELQNNAQWTDHRNIFVLNDAELGLIENYNKGQINRINRKGKCIGINYVISLGRPFEGVVGNPNTADIIVLSHNPYTKVRDLITPIWRDLPPNGEQLDNYFLERYQQQINFFNDPNNNNGYCYNYNFDPRVTISYKYWNPVLMGNTEANFSLIREANTRLANKLSEQELYDWVRTHTATLELFGYHSAQFDSNVRANGGFPHMQTLNQFLGKACKPGKIIFIAKQIEQNKRPECLNNYIHAENGLVVCVGRRQIRGGWPKPEFRRGNVVFERDYFACRDATDENTQNGYFNAAADAVVERLRQCLRR